jgi:hypothetical protein
MAASYCRLFLLLKHKEEGLLPSPSLLQKTEEEKKR